MTVLPWFRQYAPKTLSDVKGQDAALDQLKKYVAKKQKKALLLYGPTGTGKTAAVYALARDLNFELIEVNASDVRNKDAINTVLGGAVKQMSLFSKGKIILIDEIDGISGNDDRGGMQAITELIAVSTFPIIITGNDIFEQKFSQLRKHCMLTECKPLPASTIAHLLKDICAKEHITYDENVLNQLARMAEGDARSAINDLQVLASDKKLLKDDLDLIGQRTKTTSMQHALAAIFKTRQPEIVRRAYETVDQDIDKVFLWVDENLPKEYSGQGLASGFDMLSLADVFYGRIRHWQYYRFYVYCYEALSTGIALAKEERNPAFVTYTPTTRLLKIWMANQKYAKRKAIAAKLGAHTHQSGKKALSSVPLLQTLAHQKQFIEELELSEEEQSWLIV
ncbi:MAG: replication factor C large subunit [archaeon]